MSKSKKLAWTKRLRQSTNNLPFTSHYSWEANGFPYSAARVVEWQTRTFEGRMPKGMRVQVPPRALLLVNSFAPDCNEKSLGILDRI